MFSIWQGQNILAWAHLCAGTFVGTTIPNFMKTVVVKLTLIYGHSSVRTQKHLPLLSRNKFLRDMKTADLVTGISQLLCCLGVCNVGSAFLWALFWTAWCTTLIGYLFVYRFHRVVEFFLKTFFLCVSSLLLSMTRPASFSVWCSMVALSTEHPLWRNWRVGFLAVFFVVVCVCVWSLLLLLVFLFCFVFLWSSNGLAQGHNFVLVEMVFI